MKIETFHDYLAKRPFRPFTILLSGGTSVHVPHPEFLAHPPDGDTAAVFDANSIAHIIDVEHVTEIDYSVPKPAKGRSTRKK